MELKTKRALIRTQSIASALLLILIHLVNTSYPAQASTIKDWDNFYKDQTKMVVELEVQLTTAGDFSVTVPLSDVSSVENKVTGLELTLYDDAYETLNPKPQVPIAGPTWTAATNLNLKLTDGSHSLIDGDRVYLEIRGLANTLGTKPPPPPEPDEDDSGDDDEVIVISNSLKPLSELRFLKTPPADTSWVDQLRKIRSWGDLGLTDIRAALAGVQIESLPGEIPSGVSNLTGLLENQASFNDASVSLWDTTNVSDMSRLFKGASAFNQDISGWNTSNVTNLSDMFSGATSFNQDISGWNVSKVENFNGMFQNAISFNAALDDWTLLANPKTSATMVNMFNGATSFNRAISGWDITRVTDMNSMFKGATAFNADISDWTVSAVTDMSSMFEGATSFNQDLSGWNVGAVTDMSSMFKGATAFNADISDWTVSAVTIMSDMFNGATSFNQAVGGWNVTSVTNFNRVFKDAAALNQGIWSWQPSATVSMTEVFDGSGMQCSSGDAFLVAIADHLPQSQAPNQMISGVFITDPTEDTVEAALEVILQKGYSVFPFAACNIAALAIANYSVSAVVNELVSEIPTNTGGSAVSMTISPALPTGLLLDNTNGGISGSLSYPYSGTHTVTASNQHGDATFSITISITNPPNQPPVQTTPAPMLQPIPVIDQSGIETSPGTEQLLTGARFELIRSASINGLAATISQLTPTSFVIEIPGLEVGTYSLDLETTNGRISYQGLIKIAKLEAIETQEVSTSLSITGLNPRSSWLNKTALAELEEIFTGQSVVTCIAYNDRPGLAARKKALSRAMHACRIADQLGLETRVFVYGKAAQLADTVKILFR